MGQEIQRITQCGSCGKPFTYAYDLERVPAGVTSYPVVCPHCKSQLTVQLGQRRRVVILRGSKPRQQEIIDLILPDNPIATVGEVDHAKC